MFKRCCPCFFRSREPMHDPLLNEQRELSYNTISYQIPAVYKQVNDENFKGLLYRKPATAEIFGGWKLHMSLDPVNKDKIAYAWTQIIVPRLVFCGIREFKIVQENKLDVVKDGAEGQGKLITVYLRHNTEFMEHNLGHTSFVDILKQIEIELIQAEILPGPTPDIDCRIQGSNYMSFRCDIKHNEEAERAGIILPLTAGEAEEIARRNNTIAYNPYNISDSYGLLKITINSVLSYSI